MCRTRWKKQPAPASRAKILSFIRHICAMNPHLQQLQPYPFARLREAVQGIVPPAHLTEIPLYIGEPKHPAPCVIRDALLQSLDELSKYPLTLGLPELRQACADWLKRRYDGLTLNPDSEILPVLGSAVLLCANRVERSGSAGGGQPQPVLSDLRGRNAAGRR